MRADQFGWCVTAWEALFGERPFAGQQARWPDGWLARNTAVPLAACEAKGWSETLRTAHVVCMADRRRAAAPLCALVPAATMLHWTIVDRLIPMPASETGRALLAIAGGFALLGLSLLASVRFRRRHLVDHGA